MGTTTARKGRSSNHHPKPILNRVTEFRIAPRRVLEAGDEADVHFPEKRKSARRAKFVYATGNTLVFVHPATGGLVGVLPEKVGTIHRLNKLRGS